MERFRRLVEAAAPGQGDVRCHELAHAYRQSYEQCWRLVEGAAELLTLIKSAGLQVVVVTNNNVLEQEEKFAGSTVELVDALVTSEEVGCWKPAAGIFQEALIRAGCAVNQAVMLGDAWGTDIEGARAIGIRVVWLNRLGEDSPDTGVSELRSLVPADQALRVILFVTDLDPGIAYGAACERVWNPASSSA